MLLKNWLLLKTIANPQHRSASFYGADVMKVSPSCDKLRFSQVPVRLASTAQGAPCSQTLWVVQWGTSVLEVTSVLQEAPLHLRVPQVGLPAAAAYQHFSSRCWVSC